jgi:tetratricopeptide (TPR) repeat protein
LPTAARLTADERVAYQLGVRHFERGEDDAAIAQLTRVVATRPRFADVHYLLGLLYERRGDLDEATQRLEAAVALNPGYAEARLALATVWERRGDFARSETVVLGAPQAPPSASGVDALTQAKLANLQAALGDAYREAGELAEAAAAYRKALDRCPHFHDIRYRLAVVLRQSGLPDQAIRELSRVLAANPAYADAAVQLGLVYWSLGQADRACARWREALAVEPSRQDAAAYLRLAERGERPGPTGP